MLRDMHFPIFKRQRETLPQAIETLESLARQREITRSGVIRVSLEVAHNLRNQLTSVSVLIELTEAMEGQEGKE